MLKGVGRWRVGEGGGGGGTCLGHFQLVKQVNVASSQRRSFGSGLERGGFARRFRRELAAFMQISRRPSLLLLLHTQQSS